MSADRPTVLVIEDEAQNRMIVRGALENEFSVIEASNGLEGLEILKESPPDVIILDLRMPKMDGFQFLQEFQHLDPSFRTIPILVLTASTEYQSRLKALSLGATDFITKPFDLHELRLRVRNNYELKRYRDHLEELVEERTIELRDAYRALKQTQVLILEKLGRAAEYRDDETGQHIQRMAHYSRIIAQTMGLPRNVCEMIFLAAPMHDIGKIGIPDGVLLKPGRLQPGEFDIMKRHTIIGADILSGTDNALLEMGRRLALYHHEKWDGTGYPEGLKGEDIPIEARIVACADVFDALTSNRIYRPAWPTERAIDYIFKNSGTHFDPDVVEAFRKSLEEILYIKNQIKDIENARTHIVKIYEEYVRIQEQSLEGQSESG